MMKRKIYLDVPFIEKDRAKSLGAMWDAEKKKWFYVNPEDKYLFTRWEINEDGSKPRASEPVTPFMEYDDLSEEQQEFIDKVKEGNNVLVDACIGSGKTTAIQVLCNKIIFIDHLNFNYIYFEKYIR